MFFGIFLLFIQQVTRKIDSKGHLGQNVLIVLSSSILGLLYHSAVLKLIENYAKTKNYSLSKHLIYFWDTFAH